MKKIAFLSISLFFIVFRLFAQENVLILVHPTEYNLKLFTYLTDNRIIDVENLKIIGVYHKKEVYDYSASQKFLTNHSYQNIELIGIDEEISADMLYKNNSCTPAFTKLFKNSNGIIFMGGPDLPPAMYNSKMNLLTRMTDPYRHYFEASFLFHLLGGSQNQVFTAFLEEKSNYTVYAICLGMQTINIATGGTLLQDIPNELYGLTFIEEVLDSDKDNQHRNYNNNLFIDSLLFPGSFHKIKISNQNPLVGNYKRNKMPLVYSNHHQAIDKLGKNLAPIATSFDGKIIEAITHTKFKNVLGIQFHPEGTYLYNPQIKYRKHPKDELTSGKQILTESNSFQFHLEFWKTFSDKLNGLN